MLSQSLRLYPCSRASSSSDAMTAFGTRAVHSARRSTGFGPGRKCGFVDAMWPSCLPLLWFAPKTRRNASDFWFAPKRLLSLSRRGWPADGVDERSGCAVDAGESVEAEGGGEEVLSPGAGVAKDGDAELD